MDAQLKEYTEDEVEGFITEWCEPCVVGELIFDAGRVLRELDPIAFRCSFADMPEIWVCGNCDTEYNTEDEANECCNDE